MKTPSEYFNEPIIGKLKTKELTAKWTHENGESRDQVMPGTELEVIKISKMGDCDVYITNQWHKEYRKEPLVIIDSLVKEFIPYK